MRAGTGTGEAPAGEREEGVGAAMMEDPGEGAGAELGGQRGKIIMQQTWGGISKRCVSESVCLLMGEGREWEDFGPFSLAKFLYNVYTLGDPRLQSSWFLAGKCSILAEECRQAARWLGGFV